MEPLKSKGVGTWAYLRSVVAFFRVEGGSVDRCVREGAVGHAEAGSDIHLSASLPCQLSSVSSDGGREGE